MLRFDHLMPSGVQVSWHRDCKSYMAKGDLQTLVRIQPLRATNKERRVKSLDYLVALLVA